MREIISLEIGIFRDASSVAQRTAADSFFLGTDILCNPCKALSKLCPELLNASRVF
jgi:hypothetical protein